MWFLLAILLMILMVSVIVRKRGKEQLYLPIQPDPEAAHIFWTGGFDSTYLICHSLLIEKKKIQPIYLDLWNMDSVAGIRAKRQNRSQEFRAQEMIRQDLYQQFPETKELLLPTLVVHRVPYNWDLTRAYLRIRKELGFFKSRTITQYERMARFSWYYPYPIEVGLEKCGTGLDRATQGNRVGRGRDCRVKSQKELGQRYHDLGVFRHFRFPMVHLTKENCWRKAKEGGFDGILRGSWSCWYPKNGRACGRCEMCQKRII